MLRGDGISVRIGDAMLLNGVTVDVIPGQVVAAMGPNGAGKSTLARVLSGELHPTVGQVTIEDRLLSAWDRVELARIRAMLPQMDTLSFPFRVLDVVLLGRAPHVRGAETPLDYEIVRRALEAVAAGSLVDRIYTTLSGGERQRVQLARVLAQIWAPPDDGSRYLLLDEPTATLDLAHQHQVLYLGRRLAAEGVAVFVVLHDLNLAAQYADRLLLLKDGRVLADGSPRDVLTPETVAAVFSMESVVIDHPHGECPLVLSLPERQPVIAMAPQKETL